MKMNSNFREIKAETSNADQQKGKAYNSLLDATKFITKQGGVTTCQPALYKSLTP